MTSLTGAEIHGFVVGEKLYEGGFGEIYRATSPDGREFVIKFIRSEMVKDDIARKRFIREITLMQTVRHEHIVPIVSFGYKSSQFYLVMPHIKGDTLAQLLEKRRFSPLEAGELVNAMTAALESGHRQHIIHRDLKPENILIEERPTGLHYYLSDFGLAKRLDTQSVLTLTLSGKRAGTPEYMSPEQLLAEEADARSDLYSLTVILYEVLLGVLPFKARTVYDIMIAQTQLAPITPISLRRDFPPSLEAFLLKNLAKDRAERHQSATEYAKSYHLALLSLPEEQQKTVFWVV